MPIDETLAQTEAPQPSETPTSQTLDYYDANAEAFASSTADVDFSSVQQRFASLLPPGARVLDFGCGSGRDSRYFLKAGFDVTATDGSAELCKIARQLTGLPVRHELFQELSETEAYDGIWACSSILHLPKDELADVLRRMVVATKPGGVIYTSFKYGDFEGICLLDACAEQRRPDAAILSCAVQREYLHLRAKQPVGG